MDFEGGSGLEPEEGYKRRGTQRLWIRRGPLFVIQHQSMTHLVGSGDDALAAVKPN